MRLNGMETGYTLFYDTGEMNLNYFSYQRRTCICGVTDGYGETWKSLKKQGFRVAKITAKEIKKSTK